MNVTFGKSLDLGVGGGVSTGHGSCRKLCLFWSDFKSINLLCDSNTFDMEETLVSGMSLWHVRTRIIRRSFERLLGVQISGAYHHGHRDCTDIVRSGCDIAVVFDVGANVGQSVLKFRAAFRKARIFSFEPAKSTFDQLRHNVDVFANVSCHHIALGSQEGDRIIYLTGQSVENSLIKPSGTCDSEEVTVRTVDGFASDNQIERIDLLKIDTEGFDLEVLRGAQGMLASGRVAFVLVEVGFHPADNRHVLFDDIRSFLLPMGYAVFGIYDQHLEWTGEQRLRFANVCFSDESAFR